MTIGARSLDIGFVDLRKDGAFFCRPMRIVAGGAELALHGGYVMGLFCPDLIGRMAGKAEVIAGFRQEARLIGGMGRMTGNAFPFGKRQMGTDCRDQLLEPLVAAEAD